jgi:murein DD-endopeptidase MepM/ murein hydrolase activator NlpD
MCCVVEPDRSLRWFRLAIFASISVAAAGCSGESQRFDSNPFQSQAGSSAGEVTGSVAQRSSKVQSAPLPAPPDTAAMQPPATGPATTGGTAARRVASPAGSQPAAAASGNLVHVVAPGETLMKLSRQYHKSLSEIARANNIPPHSLVKVGDRIVIPGVRGSQAAAAKAAAPAPVAQTAKPVPEQKVASAPPPATARVVTPVAHNPEPDKSKRDVTAAMPTFRWPVRGRVISAFGPRPSGQQNDGINVAVPEGTPIKAAEDGVVAYAGNELKSYGNLVLVRHSNGYVTAYAHAGEILVKRDDPVKRGQVIAKSGQTGSVAAPQMHFEIRKGSTPVDPMPFLDKGGST